MEIAGSRHVDANLSATSKNPVQNKVVKAALDSKKNDGWTAISADEVLPYLYQVQYDSLDYKYAEKWFEDNVPSLGGECTSVRNGNFYGRNFDWTYDEMAEFVVSTPASVGRHAVIGTAHGITAPTRQFMQSGQYDDRFRVLPFMLVDGINDSGVVANANVVPMDNAPTGTTSPTGTLEKTISAAMLIRFMLDHFSTASDAVTYVKEHCAVYMSPLLAEQHYEVHFMVADKDDTFLMEFIDGQTEVTSMNQGSGSNVAGKPYMTNFYLNGVTFNPDGKVYSPKDVEENPSNSPETVNGITPNGCGLERYNHIVDNYGTAGTAGGMKSLMEGLKYTTAYDLSNGWYTEFVGVDGLTCGSPSSEFEGSETVSHFIDVFADRSRNPGDSGRYGTWQTVHTAIYDIEGRSLTVYTQEDYDRSVVVKCGGSGGSDGKAVIDNTDGDRQMAQGDVYIRANGDIMKKGGAPGLAGIKWSDAATGGETVLMLDEPVVDFPFDGAQSEIASFISVNGIRMVAPDGSTEIGYGIPIPFPSHGASDYAVVMAGAYGATAWGWGLFTKTEQDYWYDGAKEPTWGDAELIRSTGGEQLLNMAVSQEKVAQYDGYETGKADLVGGTVPRGQLPIGSSTAMGIIGTSVNYGTKTRIVDESRTIVEIVSASQDGIDARSNPNSGAERYGAITPNKVDYAVRSVSPLITSLPANAASPIALTDASATTRDHSFTYTHAPDTAPTYQLPAVTNTTISHQIDLTVTFSATALSCDFQDSDGNPVVPQSTPEIKAGTVINYLCEYIVGEWVVMPLVIERQKYHYQVAGASDLFEIFNGKYNLVSGTHGQTNAVYSNGRCQLKFSTNSLDGTENHWCLYINGQTDPNYTSTAENTVTGTYNFYQSALSEVTVTVI